MSDSQRIRIVLDDDAEEMIHAPLAVHFNWRIHHRVPRSGDQNLELVMCTDDEQNWIHFVDDHKLGVKYLLFTGPRAREFEEASRDEIVNWPTQMILERAREADLSPGDHREVLHQLAVDSFERGFDQQVADILTKAFADEEPMVRAAAARAAKYLGWSELSEQASAVASGPDEEEDADEVNEDDEDEHEEDDEEDDSDENRGPPPIFVDHFLARIPPSTLGPGKHLEAAEALVSRELLEELGEMENLAEMRRFGYRHMWLATLQQIGKTIEEQDRDAELPVEYWHHLSWAAAGLDYPQMIPFLVGKAERRPERVWYDVLAALVVLDRRLPESVRARHAAAAASIKAYVDWMESLDPSHPDLFRDPKAEALYARFLEEELLEPEPDEERYRRINRDFQAMFNEVFTLATNPDLTADLEDAAWSIIDVNYFLVSAGGLISYAQVWWLF